MREIPSSLYLVSPSMMSRDPDGVNLPEDCSSKLEPSGSHYENGPNIMIDDFRDEREGETALEIKKMIGLPPPPPSGKPPKRRKKKSSKSSGNDDASLSTMTESELEEKQTSKKTNEVFVHDDCRVHSTDKRSKTPSPSEEIVHESFKITKITPEDNHIVASGKPLEDNNSALPSDSTILLRDTRASPTVRNEEDLGLEITPHSTIMKNNTNRPPSVTTLEQTKKTVSPCVKLKSKEKKRTKKRGFLKKLFRGGKNHEDTELNESITNVSFIASAPETERRTQISGDGTLPKLAIFDNLDYDFKAIPVDDRQESESIPEILNAMSTDMDNTPDDRSNNNEQSIRRGHEKCILDFCLDPPDNDNGDPPEHPGRPLLSPTAFRQNKIDSACDEGEQIRIETVRSRIAEIYSCHEENLDLGFESNSFQKLKNVEFASGLANNKSDDLFDIQRQDDSDTKSPLQIETDTVPSKDPVGVSPLVREGSGGCGMILKNPEARDDTRTPSSDPVGASFCHASKIVKSLVEEQIFYHTDDHFDLKSVEKPMCEIEADETYVDRILESRNSNNQDSSIIQDCLERPGFVSPGEGRFAPQMSINNEAGSQNLNIDTNSTNIDSQALSIVENDENELISSKKVSMITEKSGSKSASIYPIAANEHLTVSAAASTNAKAIAYLHRLQGEPSPRLMWHSKNSLNPPLAENSLALAKIRAFNSKRKKGNIGSEIKMKGPSPHEYSATNFNVKAMIEKNYLNYDPSKQFAPYSRFKGRRPRKKNVPNLDLKFKPLEIPARPLQTVVQHTLDLKSVVPSEKLSRSAVARGMKLKRIKRGGVQSERSKHISVNTIQKPLGVNRFNFFPANESEIKDPIQRAGRRLLSKAAVPIQSGIRMFLSRREAMDRVWAIVRIQSFLRRWSCEANLHAHKCSALLVQKVYRGCRVREELKNRNVCATKIQRIVRGYVTALHAYETMFYICRAQALARGFLVRTSNIRRAKARQEQRNAAFVIQNCYRNYVSRRNVALKKESCATIIQSVWRSFAARIAFEKRISVIVVVQSILRRRTAIRAAELIRKSVHSAAIIKFQALWRGYALRNERQKAIAATKIQASWRGFQAYTDFIFVIVDILVVQRSARQWLAKRKTNKLRKERAATVLQSAWRRKLAQINLLHSLAQIIVVQSIVRRFLAKKETKMRRDKHKENASLRRKKDLAATAIQKSWRGFWGYSHYVIVQYEITRIQALMRGRIAQNRFNLKVGCAILIQSVSRRFLARKVASKTVIDKTIMAARALELRERNSAKHIQFWWRIVLDWMKEKKAALVIEKFFLLVKSEVDRELREIERKRIASKKSRKKLQNGGKVDEGEDWKKSARKSTPQVIKKDLHSQRVPLSRSLQKNLKLSDNIYNTFPNRDDHHGFIEETDMQPPTAILRLAPSEDFSMVSNITNPSILNQFSKDFEGSNTGQTNSEELYQEVRARSKNEKNRRLSTEDYIKKYGGMKTAPNKSLPKSSSQYFFSDDKKSGENRKKKRQSYDGTSAMYTPRHNRVMTPRKGSNRFGKPMSFSTETPVTPKSISGGGPRNGSTPRNTTNRSRRERSSSEFLPPVTPTRKKSAAIMRSVTSVTECSTPTENEKMYIPPRPRALPRKHSNIHGSGRNAVMIMKTNPNSMEGTTIEEAHEIMLLGDEYGEV